MSEGSFSVPTVGRLRAIKVPPFADRTLRTGLRVLAARRPAIPRVEMRLRIPAGHARASGDGAASRLMPEVLLGGTAGRSSVDIAVELQRLGATLDTGADPDDVVLGGSTLASSLEPFLDLVAEIVTSATFPAREVAVGRDRLAQEITIALSQPQTAALQAFRGRYFGRHPYGRPLPTPERVLRLGAAGIRRFHAEHVLPRGSTLVLVGALQPDRAVDQVERAFARWKGRGRAGAVPFEPRAAEGPVTLVDRPGSVQTTFRIGGPAVPRRHPDFPALALANLVFGGYFASRLVRNIRETKGYTYSPGSVFEHRRASSTFFVTADVGTAVTAPALVEIMYELGRISTLPPDDEELEQAKRYFAGVTSLSIQSQGGLAGVLDSLLASGLDTTYFKEMPSRVAAVTRDEVLMAAAKYLAPANLVSILVGDASAVRRPLEAVARVGPL